MHDGIGHMVHPPGWRAPHPPRMENPPTPPRWRTPPDGEPPPTPPDGEPPPLVNVRVVRILLECILFYDLFPQGRGAWPPRPPPPWIRFCLYLSMSTTYSFRLALDHTPLVLAVLLH